MDDPVFRVLVDLSYASLGYCGIAQESRVLLKTLYHLEGVEPTGLIFGRGDAVITHRFVGGSCPTRRAENHALFLQALVDPPALSGLGAMHWWQQFRTVCRLAFGRRVQTEPLDNEVLWDAVWRNLLARSLVDEDIAIARRCPMLLANLGGRMMAARSVYRLPAPRLYTHGFDFVLFHDSQAIKVSPGTCKLIRYYDHIPGLLPDLVKSRMCIKNHFRAIARCLHDSIFVCSSQPTQDDLLRAFPELEERCVVIPDVLSSCYYPEHLPQMLPAILQSRQAEEARRHTRITVRGFLKDGNPPPYLIMTSTLEPRKNHVTLIRAFEKLSARHQTDLRLVIVGKPGWKCEEVLQAMKPLIEQHRLYHLENVPLQELRVLYTHAQALVFPSFYEGFGYTPLEAMCCHTPVLAADIATHRWVYGDAAIYFDPYRVDALVEAMELLLFAADTALRDELVSRGKKCIKRYGPQAVGAKWLALFTELRRQGITSNVADARLGRANLNVDFFREPREKVLPRRVA
jgi:glycosyltransferase involved in cell wall biosynthesis